MDNDWKLKELFSNRNDHIASELSGADVIKHSTSKGDESELIWKKLFEIYLPERYTVTSGFVADSKDNFSQQIDILIFDRQYSPFIFVTKTCTIIPAESVYAVFEVKQSSKPAHIRYAKRKIASVRKLHRTSQAVVHAGGISKPRVPPLILGGILALDVGAKDAKKSLLGSLARHSEEDRIDLGCIANHGYFSYNGDQTKSVGDYPEDYDIYKMEKPVMKFLFEFISRLQNFGTVPAISMEDYAKLLD